MRILISLLTVITVFMLNGCAGKTGHAFLEKASEPDIAQSLVANRTTKDEVKQKFGDPQDVDFEENGNEKWVYSFTRSSAKAANFVPVVSAFYRGTNDTTKKLKIVFNKEGKLLRYAFTSSQGETKLGAFQ